MNEPRICVSCGNQAADEAAPRCLQCGWRMTKLTPTKLFVMGWVFAVVGGFLTVLMALVLWGISYSESTSTAAEAALEFCLFALVIVIGLFFLGAGVWMINRRRTNKFIFYGGMGLLGLFVIAIFITNLIYLVFTK